MTQTICIRVLYRTPDGHIPIGVIRNISKNQLNHVKLAYFREKCQEPSRGFMNEDDIFLYAPRGGQTLFCPVAKADEATFTLEEYLSGYGPTVVIQSSDDAQSADNGNENQQIAEREATSMPTSEVDRSKPVIATSYVLGCWGSKSVGNQANSYTVTPLPDYSFKEDMTFCVFARTLQNGRRCVLSVESPYHENSLLSIGTCENSREVEVYTLASGTTKSESAFLVQHDEWTHIALVWNVTNHGILLYVNGQQTKQVYLEQRDKVQFMQSLKDLRLVLGRSKLDSGITAGWDGEIADVRVWQRALDEGEIRTESDARVKLSTSPLTSGGWKRC